MRLIEMQVFCRGWSGVTKQRVYIKIETLRGKKADVICIVLINHHQDYALAARAVRKWVARFGKRKESIKDDELAGCP